MTFPLTETIALVTGASRGVGKGIAIGLGEAGATVYVTGRTTAEAEHPTLPGTIDATAEAVTLAGGHGLAIACDHTDDQAVEHLFDRIRQDHDRLNVLVNNAWSGYERMMEDGEYTWEWPFWEQPLWRWEAMFGTGVRGSYVASRLAAPLMIARKHGLIVNVSYWAAQTYTANVIYGAAKAATDRMSADMAHELKPHQIAVVSLYPGLVRTERVVMAEEYLDLSNSESPVFIGRAVAALAADDQVMNKTGRVLLAATLAQEYGFTDIDGSQPRPLTPEEV